MKTGNNNQDQRAREIIEEMKAQGVLDEILPPGQTGILEIEFSDRIIQCQVQNEAEEQGQNKTPRIVD